MDNVFVGEKCSSTVLESQVCNMKYSSLLTSSTPPKAEQMCLFSTFEIVHSGVASPKILGGGKNLGEPKCLTLDLQQYFVWDTASQSRK